MTNDKDERKATPMVSGCVDYFPAALAEVAKLSKVGSDQHNPGQPMHWARGKSNDHADCVLRHLMDRGTIDTDGVRHSAKVAWRALALLQIELEEAGLASAPRGARPLKEAVRPEQTLKGGIPLSQVVVCVEERPEYWRACADRDGVCCTRRGGPMALCKETK